MEKGTTIFFNFGIIPVTGVGLNMDVQPEQTSKDVETPVPVLIKPKTIIHLGKTEERLKNIDSIINKLSEVMWLSESQSSLLQAYCLCRDGFAPSKAYLQRQPGLRDVNIKRVRAELEKKNLIQIIDNHIYIRWGDYCALCAADVALMKEGMTRTKKKNLTLNPLVIPKPPAQLTDDDLAAYYCDTGRLIRDLNILDVQDKEQADLLVRKLRNYKKKIEKEVKKEAYFQEHPDEHASPSIENYDAADIYDRTWKPERNLKPDPNTDMSKNSELPF